MNPNLLVPEDRLGTPHEVEFGGLDSKARYANNLINDVEFRTQWFDHPVSYRLNSDYYRCPEWEDIDWSESVVLFGDSWAFGLGLDSESTISSRLSDELGGIPVINLGQTGVSWTFNWINSVRMIDAGIRPRAVVYIWPGIRRYSRLISDKVACSGGVWDVDKPGISREYTLDTVHSKNMSIEILRTVRTLWSCPQLHYAWREDVSDISSEIEMLTNIDKARDQIHPGPKSTAAWARNMARKLSAKIWLTDSQ